MNVTTISEFRKNSKKYVDQIIDSQDILIIARSNGQSIVAMPLDQYNSMTETEYLLSNPVNADRLRKGIIEAKSGKTTKKTLADLKKYE